MLSAEPTRVTDDLWLAAHDSLRGTTHLGERALGVGLATGLLAELVHGGFLNLREGELFRTTRPAPDDPALSPLLEVMAAEENTWPQAPPVRARASVRGRETSSTGHRGHPSARTAGTGTAGRTAPSARP
jgi:hypothetical protein